MKYCLSKYSVFMILCCKQESPPVWTQEAYRPPRSKCSLLLFYPRGGTHPDLAGGGRGGTPSCPGQGGTPVLSWGGYPIPRMWAVKIVESVWVILLDTHIYVCVNVTNSRSVEWCNNSLVQIWKAQWVWRGRAICASTHGSCTTEQ